MGVTLAFTDNELSKQLLYSLDESIWGGKIAALEEFSYFFTLTCEKLLVN